MEMSEFLLSFGICVALPITIVWLRMRWKMKGDAMRKEIILAAMEKNAEINVEDFFKKTACSQKLIKEKLLRKLLIGSVFTFMGVGMLILDLVLLFFAEDAAGGRMPLLVTLGMLSFLLLGIGLPFVINYYVGKTMLAREIEAETEAKINQER